MNSKNKRIKDFFDGEALVRDQNFFSDPILVYEQRARQEAILSLISGCHALGLDAGYGTGRDFDILLQHVRSVVAIDFSHSREINK